MNWTSGQLGAGATLTVATNGVLNMGGSGTLQLFGALTNAGTVNWTGTGNLEIYNGYSYTGGINNLAGAVFNAQNDQSITCACYGNEYFNNAGLFLKSPTTGTTTIGVAFNNTGTVGVGSGTLAISSGGVNTGVFTNAPGTTISFPNNYALSSGSQLTGIIIYWWHAYAEWKYRLLKCDTGWGNIGGQRCHHRHDELDERAAWGPGQH